MALNKFGFLPSVFPDALLAFPLPFSKAFSNNIKEEPSLQMVAASKGLRVTTGDIFLLNVLVYYLA